MTRYQCSEDAPFGVARTLHLKGGKMAGYYFGTMKRAVPAIRSLLDFFRENRMQVVFLTQGTLFRTWARSSLPPPYSP